MILQILVTHFVGLAVQFDEASQRWQNFFFHERGRRWILPLLLQQLSGGNRVDLFLQEEERRQITIFSSAGERWHQRPCLVIGQNSALAHLESLTRGISWLQVTSGPASNMVCKLESKHKVIKLFTRECSSNSSLRCHLSGGSRDSPSTANTQCTVLL